MGLTTDPSDPDLGRGPGGEGMNKKYLVLSEAERALGFVRPVRRAYYHVACRTETRMGLAIAETYARSPSFYGATFCVRCNTHLPVAEFMWVEDGVVTDVPLGS